MIKYHGLRDLNNRNSLLTEARKSKVNDLGDSVLGEDPRPELGEGDKNIQPITFPE